MKKLSLLSPFLAVLSWVWLGAAVYWVTAAPATSPPARVETEHVDFRIIYDAASGTLTNLVLRDEDRRLNYQSNEVVLVARETARLLLPAGTPFGREGDSFWVLPQSQDPNLLYLGVSAENLPRNTFESSLSIDLKSVRGPGHFFAWQASQFGGLAIKMNSADGIDNQDRTTPLVGSHEHLNWGFSTSGVYRITFRASARRIGALTNLLSPETTFTFHVYPLPPETPFQQWQRRHWPGEVSPPAADPSADPDGDGLANLLEYAFDLDPKELKRTGLPELALEREETAAFGALKFRRSKAATDLRFAVLAAGAVDAASWTVIHREPRIEDGGSFDWVTILDELPVSRHAHRFYRLQIELKVEP